MNAFPQMPPEQQGKIKKVVGLSAASMTVLAGLLMFFKGDIMKMAGLDEMTTNILIGALLFIAISDLILIKVLFKGTDKR